MANVLQRQASMQRRAGIAWILPLSCTQLLLSLQFLAAGRRRLGGSAFDSIITMPQ
jgi:hypothetical protein